MTLGIFSLYSGDIPLNEEVVLTEREEFMNASVLPVAVESIGEVLKIARLLVSAYCEIEVGMTCSVHFLRHEDWGSYAFHRNCHGHHAVVRTLNPNGSVDIEMLSGNSQGAVYDGINPGILVFDGPFVLKNPVSG